MDLLGLFLTLIVIFTTDVGIPLTVQAIKHHATESTTLAPSDVQMP